MDRKALAVIIILSTALVGFTLVTMYQLTVHGTKDLPVQVAFLPLAFITMRLILLYKARL